MASYPIRWSPLLWFLRVALSQTCVKIGSCRCAMSDHSGTIDLTSIASTNGTPRWTIEDPNHWNYSYNPCVGFSTAKFTDLAVHQDRNKDPVIEFDIGVQASAVFTTDVQGSVSILYTSVDKVRKSRVKLVCKPGTTEHNLQFVGELNITKYDFVLTTPCACPGVCNANGVINWQEIPEYAQLVTKATTKSVISTISPTTTTIMPSTKATSAITVTTSSGIISTTVTPTNTTTQGTGVDKTIVITAVATCGVVVIVIICIVIVTLRKRRETIKMSVKAKDESVYVYMTGNCQIAGTQNDQPIYVNGVVQPSTSQQQQADDIQPYDVFTAPLPEYMTLDP